VTNIKEPRLSAPTLRVLAQFAASSTELSGSQIMRATSLKSGTLYPLLQRLENAGWLESRQESGNPRKLRRPLYHYYRLTAEGEKAAEKIFEEMSGIAEAVRAAGRRREEAKRYKLD
jgi:DNA-binding PadR family transcriptional regulator